MNTTHWIALSSLALAGTQQSAPPPPPAGASPTSSVQFVQTSTCPGFTLATHSFNGTGGAIADLATTNFQINVSGAGPVLWDLDVTTLLMHPNSTDLDITLISPQGTSVVMTTDNGSVNDDVFNGTVWDETVLNSTITDYTFVNMVTATPLNPEGSFTDFRGENPNGSWTLQVTDDFTANAGNLTSWKLDLYTLPSLPPSFPITFSHTANLPVVDNNQTSDQILVTGLANTLARVEVYVEIQHTACGDLDVYLRSPFGTSVTLTTDNGVFLDNCFNGTWFDESAPTFLTDLVLANNVVVPWVEPEGVLDSITGEDPNGVWYLDVNDDANVNTGTLVRWSLKIYGCGGCTAGLTNYCTAGTSGNGCTPTMSSVGSPTASGSSSFVLHANNVEGLRSALFFYGINGRVAFPWSNTGSTSWMCVKSPVQRLPLSNTGGTLSTCNGHISLDLAAYWAAHPLALGQPLQPTEFFQVQAWYRDPPAPKSTNLTDALEFYLCP
jgi:subtilisin-like proprotein convertase family protein